MKQIEKNLKIILGKFLNINPNKIDSNTNTDNNSNWDSVVHLNILIEVEKKFKIRFTNKEINELNSYTNYIKYIDKKYAKLKK